MERKKVQECKAGWMIKSLLAAYVTSCVILFFISYLLFQFDLAEQIVNIGIMLTYIASSFVGGFVMGKQVKTRRFLWGALTGILYFTFLVLISVGIYRTSIIGIEKVEILAFCLAGGMAGGMLS